MKYSIAYSIHCGTLWSCVRSKKTSVYCYRPCHVLVRSTALHSSSQCSTRIQSWSLVLVPQGQNYFLAQEWDHRLWERKQWKEREGKDWKIHKDWECAAWISIEIKCNVVFVHLISACNFKLWMYMCICVHMGMHLSTLIVHYTCEHVQSMYVCMLGFGWVGMHACTHMLTCVCMDTFLCSCV